MFHLRDVLQFVINCLNDSPFPEQQPVRDRHHGSFHVVFEFCYQLYSVNEKPLKQVLTYISFIANEFSINELNERLVLQRSPVIHIAWGYHEVEQFSFLIADKMQFEAEEPSHGAFATLGYALEGLVDVYSLVAADTQWSAVHKTYARAFTKQDFLNEQCERHGNVSFQFHKTIVRHNLWEEMTHLLAYPFQIKVLQTTVA